MGKKKRKDLKSTFQDGENPVGSDYADVFDSFVNFESDEIHTFPETESERESKKLLKFSNGLTVGSSGLYEEGTIQWRDDFLQVFNGKNWEILEGSDWQPISNRSDIYLEKGSVGIGGPPDANAKLHIGGDLRVDGKFTKDVQLKTGVISSEEKDLLLKAGKNLGIQINKTTGHVGIGINNYPSHQLDVGGSIRARNGLIVDADRIVTGIPIYEIKKERFQFLDYKGSYKNVQIIMPFNSNVLSAHAFLGDWMFSFEGTERKIQKIGTNISSSIKGASVHIFLQCYLKDNSGYYDDSYSGNGSVICIARLEKSI